MTQLDTDIDGPRLHRALCVRDVVLFNIAAIVGLRWLSVAAQIRPPSLVLWGIALIIFFLPLASAASELSSRMPGEGGMYIWSKAAFGEMHGFVCGWSFWAVNVVYFPSLLLFLAGVSVYIAGDRWLPLAGRAIYNAIYCLIALWAVTLLNIIGVQRAKWLQNFGGVATWSIAAIIIVSAGWAWHHFGTAAVITWSNAVPDFGSVKTLSLVAIIAFAFDGYNGMEWLLANKRNTIKAAYALNADASGGELRDGKPNAVTRAYFLRTAALTPADIAAEMRAVSATTTPNKTAAEHLAARSTYYNAQLRTTRIATLIEGGHAANALPQRARATVNCRMMSGTDPNNEEDNRAHGLNERIAVKPYYDMLEFTYRLLEEL